MRLVLLGAPGAGKGTQAKAISERYHIPHISTGDILRKAIVRATPMGQKVKRIVENGQLVADDMMIELVKERLKESDTQSGFLLDGFPRTIRQAEELAHQTQIDGVIDIVVSEDELIKRLTGRRIHPASGRIYHLIDHPPKIVDKDDVTGEPLIQRVDDHEETVKKRLGVYKNQTQPLQHHYQSQFLQFNKPTYLQIDGEGTVHDVTKRIFSTLDKLFNKDIAR